MHKKLVDLALEKTGKRLKKEYGVSISFTKKSEHLAIILLEEYNVSYGDRSLREVYNGKATIKQKEVLKALCSFLDYDSYEIFLNKNFDKKENSIKPLDLKSKISNSAKKLTFGQKIVFVSGLCGFFLLTYLLLVTIEKQRWMIWKDNHYEEVDFDPKKYSIGKLKLYKEERILNFKKINGTCNDEYFNRKGEVKVWYAKNHKGELELFTSFGLHPETGKTLKPITKYMIRKYICPEY